MTLLVGYVRSRQIYPQGIRAGALGPPAPVTAPQGQQHAFEDGTPEALCGQMLGYVTEQAWAVKGMGSTCVVCYQKAKT